jgi:hypothetical protein
LTRASSGGGELGWKWKGEEAAGCGEDGRGDDFVQYATMVWTRVGRETEEERQYYCLHAQWMGAGRLTASTALSLAVGGEMRSLPTSMGALTRLGPQRFNPSLQRGTEGPRDRPCQPATKNTLDQRPSRAPAESSDFFAGGKETWLRSWCWGLALASD